MDYSARPTATLYTVGHGNHPIDRFIELIGSVGIELVIDVRSVPFSRFAPQFNKAVLEKSLGSAHIGYYYLGDLLGGRPGAGNTKAPLSFEEATTRASFQDGLRRLSALSGAGRSAVMCAERDPNRCHRKHLIARAVVSGGGTVIHLLDDGALVPEEPLGLCPGSDLT
jgi:uncharacterized protein (DUF488 family)